MVHEALPARQATRLRRAASAALTALLAIGLVFAGAGPARAAESDVIYSLVNEARGSQGLGGLDRNASLDAVAQAWAAQMAASGGISHNPSTGAQIPAGWSAWGENVAQGYPSGASMHDGWMNSSDHRGNILGGFTDVGVAFVSAAGTTWGVEVFASYAGSGGPPPAAPPARAEPAPAPPPAEAAPAPSAAPAPAATPAPTASPTPTPAPTPSATPRASRTPAPEPSETAGPLARSVTAAVDPTPFVLAALVLVLIAGGSLLWRYLGSRGARSSSGGRHRAPPALP